MATDNTILLAEQDREIKKIVGRTIYLAKHEEGCSEGEVHGICEESEGNFRELITDHWDWDDHNVEALVQTRAQIELEKEQSPGHENDRDIDVPSTPVVAQEAKTNTATPTST